jgi:hypothetical protein
MFIVIACLSIPSCKDRGSPTESVLESRDGITAKYRYDQIVSAAIGLDSTVRYKGVNSDYLNKDGTSFSWRYKFGMTVPPFNCYYFTAFYDSVRFDSISSSTVGDAFITHPWINSCDAMHIAEANGGKEFRARNPAFTISAGLGEPVVPNPLTCWYITYRSSTSSGAFLNMTIDATTGIVK